MRQHYETGGSYLAFPALLSTIVFLALLFQHCQLQPKYGPGMGGNMRPKVVYLYWMRRAILASYYLSATASTPFLWSLSVMDQISDALMLHRQSLDLHLQGLWPLLASYSCCISNHPYPFNFFLTRNLSLLLRNPNPASIVEVFAFPLGCRVTR